MICQIFISENIADTLEVTASMRETNYLKLDIKIDDVDILFVTFWDSE